MTELRLRSRTVSELVDAAFALYKADMGKYMMLVALANIPQFAVKLLFPSAMPTMVGVTGTVPDGSFPTLLLTLVTSLFTYAFGLAAVMKYGSNVYLGERADTGETVRGVLPRIFPLLISFFLKGLLYVAGFLFFFVGEFYVAARWFAVAPAIVLEEAGPVEAFGRSSELSQGRKRHILNTLLLVGIIYVLLSACVTAIAGLLHSGVLTLVAVAGYSIVAYPVVALTSTVLYYDARIRGEGFDLERMAAAMDATGLGSAPGAAGASAT
jgi:hypothetical protein